MVAVDLDAGLLRPETDVKNIIHVTHVFITLNKQMARKDLSSMNYSLEDHCIVKRLLKKRQKLTENNCQKPGS